jgi:hypothetical protein
LSGPRRAGETGLTAILDRFLSQRFACGLNAIHGADIAFAPKRQASIELV